MKNRENKSGEKCREERKSLIAIPRVAEAGHHQQGQRHLHPVARGDLATGLWSDRDPCGAFQNAMHESSGIVKPNYIVY